MKLLIILLFVCIDINAQEPYYVSHVDGKVRKASTKRLVKVGDVLYRRDSLIFNSNRDYVTLISPTKGSYIAQRGKVSTGGKLSEFVVYLRDMFPSTTIVPTAGRAGIMNSLFDFESYLSMFSKNGTPLLVIDSALIRFGPAFRENITTKFFYAQYNFDNKTINKKISFKTTQSKEVVNLNLSDSIYRIDGTLINQENIDSIKIFFYDSIKEQSRLMGTLKLRIENALTILDELCIIKEHFKSGPPAKAADEVNEVLLSHIYKNFGDADNERLNDLFKILNSKQCK